MIIDPIVNLEIVKDAFECIWHDHVVSCCMLPLAYSFTVPFLPAWARRTFEAGTDSTRLDHGWTCQKQRSAEAMSRRSILGGSSLGDMKKPSFKISYK